MKRNLKSRLRASVVAGLNRGTLGYIKSIGLQQWKHLIALRLIPKQ